MSCAKKITNTEKERKNSKKGHRVTDPSKTIKGDTFMKNRCDSEREVAKEDNEN